MYQIQDGILFIDNDCQSISIMNELQTILDRYKLVISNKIIEIPSSMVFTSEPILQEIIYKNNVYYIIISDLTDLINSNSSNNVDKELYQSILRAVTYKKNPGLIFTIP
jgi:hypothetical protein